LNPFLPAGEPPRFVQTASMKSPSHGRAQPAWTPTPEIIRTANLSWLMQRVGVETYEALQAWSVEHREEYWALVLERLSIRLQRPFQRVLDLSRGVEEPRWLPGAQMNIVESCFSAPPDSVAIIHQSEGGPLHAMSVQELAALTDRVALNLVRLGLRPGDAIAMILPMTAEAVAIYLGIVKAGCIVVGIADSFQPKEIAIRLRLANAVAVFTQDVMLRGGKELPLYPRVKDAAAPRTVVLAAREHLRLPLRAGDQAWADFLESEGSFISVTREPSDPSNILFSSGTTGEPKSIPWTHTTPLKCAADAHFHQNIQPGDVLVWPTNIGWMMGPWLIFASLLNRATMGLYDGAPNGREFCGFVQAAKTTLLGVVPSLVKTWRETGATRGVDWKTIKAFSSTGECSNADDMRWLMAQAEGKPVIEYCGGTEIGGAYITSTVLHDSVPGTFTTPTLGLDFVILDEAGRPADEGELFLVPPSIGLSTTLLHRDHHEVYFAGTPRGELLRRHGDQMQRLPNRRWRALGRADDTMNLGGIKVSSAEIERTLQAIPNLKETAAIAVAPDGGPSLLVIYAVCPGAQAKEELRAAMQTVIKGDLNPLFKIHDLVLIEALPRTASNKVMRRVLRDRYFKEA
jgi:acetyl-CoA synthetase